MNEEKVEKLVLDVLDNIKSLEILLQAVPALLKFSVKILGHTLQELLFLVQFTIQCEVQWKNVIVLSTANFSGIVSVSFNMLSMVLCMCK